MTSCDLRPCVIRLGERRAEEREQQHAAKLFRFSLRRVFVQPNGVYDALRQEVRAACRGIQRGRWRELLRGYCERYTVRAVRSAWRPGRPRYRLWYRYRYR